jgi:Fusaric acid resistance protein-like
VTSPAILAALREASVTMLAAVATLGCALALDPGPGPAVLAVVLCLSLSRSHLDNDRRGRIEAAFALPVVALLAAGVGSLLHYSPWLGALVFVAGMFVSIWLRRFGPMVRRAGSLIALPLLALLTTPYLPPTPGSRIPAALIPVVIALVALLWVSVLHALARRVGLLPPVSAPAPAAPPPTAGATLRPLVSTRMAIQMAVALAVSFAIGYWFFAERWTWIVLTAFIVVSGNRGRLDVAYKSVLRVLGAAAGTFIALRLSVNIESREVTVVLILGAVYVGLWLRSLGYGWWALFVTLAIALLQGFAGSSPQQILWLRLEEIIIGAIVGVAASWYVLPVRSTAVLRRRIAEALATLADALDPATAVRKPEAFVAALAGVEQMVSPFRATRLVTRRLQLVQPADWVDALVACRTPAVALIESKETPGPVRRAVGVARQSMRKPREIQRALLELNTSLADNLPRQPLPAKVTYGRH